MTAQKLTDETFAARGGGARPTRARIVHLGLGNFHRAHQAWYTAHASDATEWGIAAFTGRSPVQAELLAGQDGLYTLVTRSHEGDAVEVLGPIVEVHDATRTDRLRALVADPAVAVVTLTITEAGYRLTESGAPDRTDAVMARDLENLPGAGAEPESALGRLVIALDARRRAAAGPLAIVPCDNIPANGAFVAAGVTALAACVSAELAAWVAENVSFVSTSVDRITPRIEEAPAAVRDAGWIDDAPVVTEPFSDWVLSGGFPAGRPDWESAGARFADDIEPWENRKLWLLNGAHTTLALAGLLRGHADVATAVADAECLALVEAFWADAVRHLPADMDTDRYRADLLQRFGNSRIVHRLAQIAGDSTSKLRYRIAAVAERRQAEGGIAEGAAHVLATWCDALSAGLVPRDASADRIDRALDSERPARALLELVSPSLAADDTFVDLVESLISTPAADGPLSHALPHPGVPA